jgi:hypothetical protein
MLLLRWRLSSLSRFGRPHWSLRIYRKGRRKLYSKQTPHSVDTFPHRRYFFARVKGVSNFPSSVNINESGTWRIEHDAD